MSTYRLVALATAALLLIPGPVRGAAPRTVDVSCRSCIVTTGTGRVLWGRSATLPLPVASATKIATALTVAAAGDLSDQPVTVSSTAAATPGGKLSLRPGDRLSARDLVAAMLLASSNDAAVALAEHVSGSEPAFVRAMNATAADLGAEASSFVNAHGLDAPGHVSTARDLALLAGVLLEDAALAALAGSPEASITISGRRVTVPNTNLLLEAYAGADGVKTGFTAGAGNVLVGSARRGGRHIIAVALGSQDHFADVTQMLDLGFALTRPVTMPAGTLAGYLFADGAGAVPVVTDAPLRSRSRRPGPPVLSARPHLALPVVARQQVGTVERIRSAAVVAVATDPLPHKRPSWAETAIAAILATIAPLIPGEPT